MVRELPEQPERVETGPIRFGKDWCGVFIRGDNAFDFMLSLQMELEHPGVDPLNRMRLKRLMNLLASCDERTMKQEAS